jgi:hypothetical protein
MIMIGIVRITRMTVASVVADRATTAPLVTATSLLFVATIAATCSSICKHMILLLLIFLGLLHHQACFSVEKMGIESFRTDRVSHPIDMLDQRVVVSIQPI